MMNTYFFKCHKIKMITFVLCNIFERIWYSESILVWGFGGQSTVPPLRSSLVGYKLSFKSLCSNGLVVNTLTSESKRFRKAARHRSAESSEPRKPKVAKMKDQP